MNFRCSFGSLAPREFFLAEQKTVFEDRRQSLCCSSAPQFLSPLLVCLGSPYVLSEVAIPRSLWPSSSRR